MRRLFSSYITPLVQSKTFKNNFWGITASFVQNVFTSLFFVILARQYATTSFSYYLIAHTLYQLLIAFSSLGLGQWFIRELVQTQQKKELISKFLKIQFLLGLIFYFINGATAWVLYDDLFIRQLALIFGINLVFDNIISAITCINIAEFAQKKTFTILGLEAFIKFLVGCLLFILPFPIQTLAILLVLIRLLTLNLFLKIGSSYLASIKSIWHSKVVLPDFLRIVWSNWSFLVIGGVSTMYWRVGNIIISKTLTALDVANYEISFRLFSLAQILPLIVSNTVYPTLVKLYHQEDKSNFVLYYRKIFGLYFLFGLLAYTFIFSFADYLLPFIFGATYQATAVFTKQMFLTMLVFPTGLLQANLLVAMQLEKKDMWLNVMSLLAHVAISLTGLYFIQSLAIINYSILLSFLIFHLLQDVLLIQKKILSLKQAVVFYLIGFSFFIVYMLGAEMINKYAFFFIYWFIIILLFLYKYKASPLAEKVNYT